MMEYMEELAPSSIALSGDSVGLQLGHPEAEVKKLLVALDSEWEAVEEASFISADMLITHHPLFYNQFSAIDESTPAGSLIASVVRKGLHIFSAHTNYDIAFNGVSYHLAKTLDLLTDDVKVLEETDQEQMLKLVMFIPAGYEDQIRNVIAEAGAAQMGNYSHCTFQVPGSGTFRPGEGTNPFIGGQGELEKVDELRMETIMPASLRSKVIDALVNAHPYEEVAYDLYPLALEGKRIGLGLKIGLVQPISLDQLIENCRSLLNSESVRYWPAGKKEFSRIALCGGSGGSLIEKAARQGAEVLISGDFRYHDLRHAQALGLGLIDAGHDATEWPAVVYLQQYLEERLKEDNYKTEVCLAASVAEGWQC
ncbi:MAG: Nif3-like dinuclear metal center hexameric protein [Bacillota bacterium]